MKNRIYLFICSLFFLQSGALAADFFPLYAQTQASQVYVYEPINLLTISPVFGKSRMRQGTIKERGFLNGTRLNFDSIFPTNLYLGAEIGFKNGFFRGNGNAAFGLENANLKKGEKVTLVTFSRSRYSDIWGEVRIGFNAGPIGNQSSLVLPFFLIGKELERDTFFASEVLPLRNRISYAYLGVGAITKILVVDRLFVGLNFKLKWLFNTRGRVSGHEDIVNKRFSQGCFFHWDLEVPIQYIVTKNLLLGIAPMWQFKSYMRHKNSISGTERANFCMSGLLLQLGYFF